MPARRRQRPANITSAPLVPATPPRLCDLDAWPAFCGASRRMAGALRGLAEDLLRETDILNAEAEGKRAWEAVDGFASAVRVIAMAEAVARPFETGATA